MEKLVKEFIDDVQNEFETLTERLCLNGSRDQRSEMCQKFKESLKTKKDHLLFRDILSQTNTCQADQFMASVNHCDNDFKRYVAVLRMHLKVLQFQTLGKRAEDILSSPNERLSCVHRIKKLDFLRAKAVMVSELPQNYWVPQ